jgi:two-component system sensor histidine kinase YesM
MFGKDENEEPVGYGLRNVHERIKLYFGEEYGLHIDSEPGQGTQVTLQLPFESEES